MKSSHTRTYELKRRAERQEETRRRIVDATVELHTTLGPSRTSVQAIADRAGVTRPTVYAHFPDTRALFEACTGHVRETVPPPDPAPWQAISDPAARLEAALGEVYAYYERLETLFDNVERDVAVMPIVAELHAQRLRYLSDIRDRLVQAWPVRGKARARLRCAIGHALEFGTWKSLVRHQGCTTSEAVRMMVTSAAAQAEPRG